MSSFSLDYFCKDPIPETPHAEVPAGTHDPAPLCGFLGGGGVMEMQEIWSLRGQQ